MTVKQFDRSLLDPPDDTTVASAISDFAAAVQRLYGTSLRGVYLFGSRARGDHRPDSDADLAIILAGDDWNIWREQMRLAGLEYDSIIQTGAEPQAWVVREREWLDPSLHNNPGLVRAMHRDAKRIEV